MYCLATWAVMMNNAVKYSSMWRLANSKRSFTSSINGTVTKTPFHPIPWQNIQAFHHGNGL